MIIVKLQGGLGNQMFQYALGRNLSLIHNVPFKIDYSYLKTSNQSNRSFKLDGFQIRTEEATQKEVTSYTGLNQKILDRFRTSSNKKHIKESFHGFNEYVLRRGDGYFDGHWNMQSEKYFHPNETAIRKDFQLTKPFGADAQKIAETIAKEPASVSLHIRRGDYVSISKVSEVHGVLPLSYYETACEKILDKFPNAHFFIFSDDIAWAKENFPNKYRVSFVSDPEITDHEELILMSMCLHNIIANSTFSWWGAWLNQNPEKIVVAPTPWFQSSTHNTDNIVPDNWWKIKI
ncbi:MAG: alpha-1,2-fucosyltransferase [Patescibacteria group bacterium]